MAKDTKSPKAATAPARQPSRSPAATSATQTTEVPGAKLSSVTLVKGIVLVANQHTAPIIIPRAQMQGEQRIALPPLILQPGTVTPVDGIEWAVRKELAVIQHYLDRGLLAETDREGGQVGMDPTSTDLSGAIPDNLKSESEQNENAAAKVTKEISGSVEA